MGYESPQQFKAVVVDRMRREVDADRDWESEITVTQDEPSRTDDGRKSVLPPPSLRTPPDRGRRRRVWNGWTPG